jgi:hypothetical protein
MPRRFPRLLIAAGLIALSIVPAMSATASGVAPAGEEECAGTFYAIDGREVFDLDRKYVPAPLRAFPPDCASRITGESFDDGVGISVGYTLFYVDVSRAEFIAIVRSLEDAGWADDGILGSIDPGPGDPVFERPLSSADLEALPVAPEFADGRYIAPGGSSDTIVLTYADGITYDNDVTLDVPSLTLNVLLSGPFTGTDADDPSVLSDLGTIAEKTPTPTQTAVIAGGAVVLTLVLGWPSSLLNSVVGSRYDGLVRWWQKRFRRKGRDAATAKADPAPAHGGGSRLPGWLMWPGFALAAILGAFIDPDFGVNEMSLRVVVTLFLSFVLFNLVTWALVRVIARRIQPDAEPLLRFRWGSLFLVALAVVIARLLQLEPGIIFGLVAGVAYATALRARNSALIALLGAGFGLVLALAAWVGYSILAPATAGTDSVPLILLTEFLAGVTVKGVSSLPLALLPLGSLDGSKVVKWRRVAWGAAYALGLAAFMLVLLTIPKAWGEVPGDFLRWVLLFGGYALVAVIIWIVNAVLLKRRPPKETPIGEQPDAITID